jgi:nucleoside-diphosphate-sugar epimerase
MVTEDMDLRPLSDYNKHKMVAERVLLSYADSMPVQIIRPATICGLSPRMRLDLTVNMLTVQALRDGVMTIYGGQQWRPSIHIDDMTDLYLFMVEHPELTGIWNAGFENHSLIQIADILAARLARRSKSPRSAIAARIKSTPASCSRPASLRCDISESPFTI